MEKTKLGISVSLAGVAVYLLALGGGITAAFLLCGYILLFEENKWLKRSAVKACALMLCFAAAYYVVDLIPSVVEILNGFVGIFGGWLNITIVDNLKYILNNAIDIISTLVFIASAIKATIKGNMPIPVIDDVVNKNID